jgi:hypothetical protein
MPDTDDRSSWYSNPVRVARTDGSATEHDTDDRPWGNLAAALLLSIPFSIWGGYVFSKLWQWFVVPIGANAIGTAHAMGIIMMCTMFTISCHPNRRSDETLAFVIASPFICAIALALGCVYKAFM